MLKRFAQISLLAVTILFLGTSIAQAYSCPLNIASFDKAVAAGPNVSPADLAKAIKIRNGAEAKHNAGDHGGSIESINEALDLIGAE